MTAIRLILAHDLALIRAALRGLLADEPDLTIVAEADSVKALQEAVQHHQPQVVVLAISPRSGLGSSLVEWLRGHAANGQVVTLSAREEPSFARLLMSAGAAAYVCEQSPPSELLHAIREAAAGRTHLDGRVASRAGTDTSGRLAAGRRGGSRSAASLLSKRETEVLKLLAQGYTNQQVADTLALSVKTAETYRVRLTKKLGVKSRAELFRYALDVGMIGPDQLGSDFVAQ